MSWSEALDIQLDIYEHHASDFGRKFAIGYMRSALGSGEVDLGPWRDADAAGEAWNEYLRVGAFNAEPVYVEPDMMTVVEAAIEGFHPEPLVESDLITLNGLLVLPRPLTYLDPHDKKVAWRYALWTVDEGTPDVVLLTLYHDKDDLDDFPVYGSRRPLPTMTATWRIGESLGVESDRIGITNRELPVDTANASEVQRQVQGIFRLLTQHLAESSRERAPRAVRRRVERLEREHVTVVRLRRPAQPVDPDKEPTTVHWSHRWIVGGHWRNQWYPTLGVHRQIWISPYVKGPDELELVVNKARVFALVR